MAAFHGIQCPCGGKVERLDDDGTFYIITDNYKLIFRGHCGSCDELIVVEKDLSTLLLLSETKRRLAN
ncbi:MAG: hypothetical protein WAX85_02560 [Minisyncoccia bacterium]